MSHSHRLMTSIATDRQQTWRDEAADDRRARQLGGIVSPLTRTPGAPWSGIDRFRRLIARAAAKA